MIRSRRRASRKANLKKGAKNMDKSNMNSTSSENYDFYYFKDSLAEKDINEISNLQEECFQDICKVLAIKPEIRIQYYLVDSPELVGKIYGDNEPCNGFAEAPNKIYAVYNSEVKCVGYHEDAHILSYTINRPNSSFIREGLAMYFDKTWWDKTNEEWVRLFLIENKYIKISSLLDNDTFFSFSDAITYPIAGAFTKFLIKNYGIEKYLLLYNYKEDDFLNIIKDVYRKELKDIEEKFILSLQN